MQTHQLRTFLAALAAVTLLPTLAMAGPAPATVATLTSASKANDVCAGGSLLASSDRGRLDTNPCTVGKRDYTVEAGYQNTSISGAAAHLTSYPAARTRVGLSNGLELDFDAPSAARFAGPRGTTLVGQTDSAVGAKYAFQNAGRYAHGVAMRAILPTGGTNVTSGRPEYDESYEGAYAINRYLTANGTVGLRQFATPNGIALRGKNQAVNAFVPTVGLSAHVLPRTNVGVEVQSVSSLGAGTSGSTYGNLFVQHAFTSRFALDLNAGQQFNTTLGQKAHYLGAGAAIRL